MARRRLNRRITQRIFIAHRGGGASSAGAVGADFAGFFAAVPGGKADIGFTVVNGVVSALMPPANRDLEPFDYATGALALGNAGFGWARAAALMTPYVGRAGLELFDTYTVGAVTGADLGAGTGWAAAPLIAAY